MVRSNSSIHQSSTHPLELRLLPHLMRQLWITLFSFYVPSLAFPTQEQSSLWPSIAHFSPITSPLHTATLITTAAAAAAIQSDKKCLPFYRVFILFLSFTLFSFLCVPLFLFDLLFYLHFLLVIYFLSLVFAFRFGTAPF